MMFFLQLLKIGKFLHCYIGTSKEADLFGQPLLSFMAEKLLNNSIQNPSDQFFF